MSNMTEPEFQKQLMQWAEGGAFDEGAPAVKLKVGFKWIEYAEDNYCRLMGSSYYWVSGVSLKVTPSSKVNGVTLVRASTDK